MNDTLETLSAKVDYLTACMHELLTRVRSNAPVSENESDTYAPYQPGPRVVEVRPNVRMMLAAPVNPKWEPPSGAYAFGTDYDGNPANGYPVSGEPSNAPPGMPLRSASGYPLFYSPVDGKVTLRWSDEFCADDDAVEAAIADRAQRQARADSEWAARYR